MRLHELPEHLPRHRLAAPCHEQRLAAAAIEDRGASVAAVTLQPGERFFAERHQPLLRALAGDAQGVVDEAHVHGLQPDQLAHAQAAGVHQLEHGAVAQAERGVDVGRSEQGLDLRLAQALRHAQRLARAGEPERRVGRHQMLAHGPAEEALPDREAAVRAGRRAARVACQRERAQIGFARLQQRVRRGLRQPLRQQRQVAPVCGERIGRQAVLDPERVDEGVDRLGARRPQRERGLAAHSSLSFCLTTTCL